MVNQIHKPCQAGPAFNAYVAQRVEQLVKQAQSEFSPPLHACAPAPERNQYTARDLGFNSGSKPRNQETKSLSCAPTTQEAPNESYKAQKPNFKSESTEAAILIDKYGDIMGIVDNHPLFRKVTAPVSKGGWDLWPQSLTKACKEHSIDGDMETGIERVIEAIRYTDNYRAARNKAKFFWSVLRNGTRKEV